MKFKFHLKSLGYVYHHKPKIQNYNLQYKIFNVAVNVLQYVERRPELIINNYVYGVVHLV
jgi:hypothetical protein